MDSQRPRPRDNGGDTPSELLDICTPLVSLCAPAPRCVSPSACSVSRANRCHFTPGSLPFSLSCRLGPPLKRVILQRALSTPGRGMLVRLSPPHPRPCLRSPFLTPAGMTSLYNGERRLKSELRFEVLGALDELNAHIGYGPLPSSPLLSSAWRVSLGCKMGAHSMTSSSTCVPYPPRPRSSLLMQVQSRLLDAGSSVATPPSSSTAQLTRVEFPPHEAHSHLPPPSNPPLTVSRLRGLSARLTSSMRSYLRSRSIPLFSLPPLTPQLHPAEWGPHVSSATRGSHCLQEGGAAPGPPRSCRFPC